MTFFAVVVGWIQKEEKLMDDCGEHGKRQTGLTKNVSISISSVIAYQVFSLQPP